ncbi:hybrid-cluster NAD(P)-dependent oxidoreductase [Flexivirga endophytica]|uniref:Hybrid-cluster NAD(P)-dependent oxidoreductase n=1 Tax=Flexivirga endophytica TaxID=1849103 RepID=A0A916WSW0_9MICO|nr:hybrid-cluster NAD(P)-dependent oxidoreductase [Flexivirga endophytica]GGB31531.1 hybrid-cluster NAD(P)-dependent oxidoreductase [Flexivirga endophytica]GHB52462.1 hybrid-cluster NAD(P)-dependent oxidoreductase [Flexivirga endophytica]
MTEILTRPDAFTAPAGSLDEALTCVGVLDVTHDVKTFLLAPQGPVPRFDAGQYLTFTMEVGGETLQRCYTISAAPTRPGPLAITVKRVPGGPVSNWLHDHFGPGDTIWATGPHGDFSHTRHPAGKYLFLSAGSGITPAMSMTRTLHDSRAADVVFVHSARAPQDIIFRDELDAMAGIGSVTVSVICEADSPTEIWQGPTGRLGLRNLLAVPDLHDREVFTCGPTGYMAATRQLLEQAGIDPARCHEELYDLAARGAAPSTVDESDLSSTRYAVQLQRTGRSLDCADNETLLHAAQRAGLNPPSMCSEGMCGTCRMTLLAGEVDMQHQGGIRQRDIDQGGILICCSKPTGDVVLDA